MTINEYELKKIQKGSFEYEISVFKLDEFQFNFSLSLQPSGNDEVLPSYQLSKKTQIIPDWILKNLDLISEWIKNNK
jgi:hypothetical protein